MLLNFAGFFAADLRGRPTSRFWRSRVWPAVCLLATTSLIGSSSASAQSAPRATLGTLWGIVPGGAGSQVWLESGEFVTVDSQDMFAFRSVKVGWHSVRATASAEVRRVYLPVQGGEQLIFSRPGAATAGADPTAGPAGAAILERCLSGATLRVCSSVQGPEVVLTVNAEGGKAYRNIEVREGLLGRSRRSLVGAQEQGEILRFDLGENERLQVRYTLVPTQDTRNDSVGVNAPLRFETLPRLEELTWRD